MCKDYNHLLFRDEFLRVSSLEGLHCLLWCTYQRSQQSLFSGVGRIGVAVSVGLTLGP